jgi:hypothetical protein
MSAFQIFELKALVTSSFESEMLRPDHPAGKQAANLTNSASSGKEPLAC